MEFNYIFDVKFLNDKKANADMEINIEIPQGVIANLYWADESGVPLEDYTAIKSIPLFDGKATYKIENALMIPEKAATIRCRVFNDFMNEIELPELTKEIPAEKRLQAGELKRKFIVTSDIHLGGEYFNNTANRKSAFGYMRDAKPEFVLISGDITDNCNPNEFVAAKEHIEMLEGIPVFLSTGNHDLAPYKEGCYPHYDEMNEFFTWQKDRSVKLGATASEIHFPKYYYDARVNGVHIIVLDACNEKNQFYLGDEQLKWLDEKLTESDGERYRFVISHFHQKGNIVQTRTSAGVSFYKENDEVQEILDRHKNVIHSSGHTHYNFDSDLKNTHYDSKNNNLYINAGCAVWNGVCMNERREYYVKNRCTGQVVEVYDNYVITRGIEFVSGKYISRCIHFSEM